MTQIRDVAGYCPMGCGQALHLMPSGMIRCMGPGCPEPDAVTRILNDPETEHVVWFEETTFTLMHPLRERLAGEDARTALAACALNEHIRSMDGPPVAPGRYRALAGADGGWEWEGPGTDPGAGP